MNRLFIHLLTLNILLSQVGIFNINCKQPLNKEKDSETADLMMDETKEFCTLSASSLENDKKIFITSRSTSFGYTINYSGDYRKSTKLVFDGIDRIRLSYDENGHSDGSVLLENDGEIVGALSSLKILNNKKQYIKLIPRIEGNAIIYVSDEQYSEAYLQAYTKNDFNYWFNSSTWIHRNGVVSLSLNHKSWAYLGIETGPITWSWNTVISRHHNDYYWANQTGLRDQYACHVNFAANKNPWNIEPSRPNVGYAATVAAGCNP